MNRQSRIWRLPTELIRMMFLLIGRADEFARLFRSLQVSTEKAGEELRWEPAITFEQGLRKTVEWHNNK